MATTLMLKLVGDDSIKLRGMFAPDGMQVFSVYDFISYTCAKNDKGACARNWYKDNVKDDNCTYHNEFNGHIYSLKFPGMFLASFRL
jgi:hypothetical protein